MPAAGLSDCAAIHLAGRLPVWPAARLRVRVAARLHALEAFGAFLHCVGEIGNMLEYVGPVLCSGSSHTVIYCYILLHNGSLITRAWTPDFVPSASTNSRRYCYGRVQRGKGAGRLMTRHQPTGRRRANPKRCCYGRVGLGKRAPRHQPTGRPLLDTHLTHGSVHSYGSVHSWNSFLQSSGKS